jgi:hypothetical protein
MPDTKISDLPSVTSLTGSEEIACSDGTTTTKAFTPAQMLTYLQARGLPRVYRLNTDHAISTVAGTEATAWRRINDAADVAVTLEAGTYMFQYNLLIQSATATVSPLYGVNFTGTHTSLLYGIRYWDAGPLTAGTAVADNTNASATTAQGPISGQVHNVATTTAPILAHTGGVAVINVNHLVILEGIVVATATGDLELWHGSETASSTTIKAGSALMVVRNG